MALASLLSWPFHNQDPGTTVADHDRMVRVAPTAIYCLRHRHTIHTHLVCTPCCLLRELVL